MLIIMWFVSVDGIRIDLEGRTSVLDKKVLEQGKLTAQKVTFPASAKKKKSSDKPSHLLSVFLRISVWRVDLLAALLGPRGDDSRGNLEVR